MSIFVLFLILEELYLFKMYFYLFTYSVFCLFIYYFYLVTIYYCDTLLFVYYILLHPFIQIIRINVALLISYLKCGYICMSVCIYQYPLVIFLNFKLKKRHHIVLRFLHVVCIFTLFHYYVSFV